ncbi:MAG: beta-lactamase family protein [Chloroflexi bacterium]|nr:beta-lactamase family protein [Chloroflexota bacterium]
MPLPRAKPSELGLDAERVERLLAFARKQVADGVTPGVAVAMARHGKVAVCEAFGNARTEPKPAQAVGSTLWLLYSSTKPLVAAGVWTLIERGLVRFTDRVADVLPEFQAHGKQDITLAQVLTHQAGFPTAKVSQEAYRDHRLLREEVCDFKLEWPPGAKVQYHSTSAHWVLAALIEALTGKDFRDYLRHEVFEPVGLTGLFVGVPAQQQHRCADMHDVDPHLAALGDNNSAAYREAGVPGAGGYATAEDLCGFYQLLVQGGSLNGKRVLSRRMIEYVTRNHTGDRIDEALRMPMHRGMGVHVRGETATIRGLGTIAHPATFGHGGAGTSYSWADPDSGVSFAYLTNRPMPEPAHSRRIDIVSNLAHACIAEPSL